MSQGKNLVGAFHQPVAVLIDPDTLDTLPDAYVCDGMAEVIKYGCIKDAEFFENLATENALDHIEDVIETCVSIKRDVVSRDEREAGERMLLNFGHTLGHAIEKIYDFKGISHGMAVAIGMVLISKAREKAELPSRERQEKLPTSVLNTVCPLPTAQALKKWHRPPQATKKPRAAQSTLFCLIKSATAIQRKSSSTSF